MGSDLLQCRSVYDWLEYSVSEDSVYWFCTKFCQLILRKIIKIVVTTPYVRF